MKQPVPPKVHVGQRVHWIRSDSFKEEGGTPSFISCFKGIWDIGGMSSTGARNVPQ